MPFVISPHTSCIFGEWQNSINSIHVYILFAFLSIVCIMNVWLASAADQSELTRLFWSRAIKSQYVKWPVFTLCVQQCYSNNNNNNRKIEEDQCVVCTLKHCKCFEIDTK